MNHSGMMFLSVVYHIWPQQCTLQSHSPLHAHPGPSHADYIDELFPYKDVGTDFTEDMREAAKVRGPPKRMCSSPVSARCHVVVFARSRSTRPKSGPAALYN